MRNNEKLVLLTTGEFEREKTGKILLNIIDSIWLLKLRAS